MSAARFKEIELKYRADGIDLEAFTQFCQDKTPERVVIASGYDHFYEKADEPESFCRHRVGADSNQLTFKRKTDGKTNYIRTEHNIDLTPGMTEAQVAALCKEFGFIYNTTLFKNCFIYAYDSYILVYYVVYDKGMKELGRFVEIEAKEDYNWSCDQEAWDAIVAIERLSKSIGLSPQARMKKSLWEMFKK